LFGQDAGGGLIRKQAYDNNTIQTTTDYIDGFVYLTVTTGTPTLSYFAIPEGRVRYTGSALKPEYIINDQQGNARVSFEESTTPGVPVVRQENSFYASGQIMPNSPVAFPSGNTDNKQLYNGGSEWQNDFSNLPDYYQTFFRNYDAALMQFVAVDPVAESVESMSTYQYANNNPVMNNDPMGNFFTPTLPAQYTAFGSDIHSTAQFWQSYGSAWNGGTDDSGVLGFIFSHPGGGSGNGDGIDDGRSDPTSLSATKNMEYFDFINQAKSGNSDAVEAYAAHYGQTVDIFVSNKGDVAVTAGGKHSWIDTQNEDGTWHYRELANQGGQCPTCLVPESVGRFPQIEIYGGWNNPMSYNGKENYDLKPRNYTDVNTKQHDKDYDVMGGKGPLSVFFNTDVIPADEKLIVNSFGVALDTNGRITLKDKLESLFVGTLFSIVTAPKIALSLPVQ